MVWTGVARLLATALITAMLIAATSLAAGAQDLSELDALNKQVAELSSQKKYAEAAPVAERALAMAERMLGKEHPDTLRSVNTLAVLYQDQGRYSEAEQLFTRLVETAERVLGPEDRKTIVAVGNLATLYLEQHRYREVEPLLKRVVEARERTLGSEHPSTLLVVGHLAALYRDQGRYSEAEPLLKRSVEATEWAYGIEHPDTLSSLNSLALLYKTQGRYNDAEPLYLRALEARGRVLGQDNPDTLTSVSNLASLYVKQGRYGEAEPLYIRAGEAFERVSGIEDRQTLITLSHLAGLYNNLGRYSESEPVFKRVLEVRERTLGREHPDTLISATNLAVFYDVQGRDREAERLYKHTLAGFERIHGFEHPNTLTTVYFLAGLYDKQERYSEAEPLYQRALQAQERILGKEHPDTLESLNKLALLYKMQGRYSEAEPLYKRALEGRERLLGQMHPDTLVTLHNLGALYHAQGRYAEAELLHKKTLEASERVLGREKPSTLSNVNGLAGVYSAQGRYSEAEQLYKRVLEARERILDKNDPDIGVPLTNLASLYFKQNDWAHAVEFWRRSTKLIIERVRRDAETVDQASAGAKSEVEQMAFQFWGLVKAASRLAPQGRPPSHDLTREMFQAAQWAFRSEAARSLAQMAARGASGDPKLAALVRERQDLVSEWQKRDGLRNAALGQSPEKRNTKGEAENVARLAAIDLRMADIDSQLATEFPDYAALASPQPLSVEEVQTQLGTDEALVLFLATDRPEETFIWVVTKRDARWVRSDLGREGLLDEVRALRCGLNEAAWAKPYCPELLGQHYSQADRRAGKPLPFDHARAYKLYKALFGEVEDLIKGKSLLIVQSGPLTVLPFQVLVTEPPAGNDHRSMRWLARDHAITVLPTVSSLKTLRHVGRASAAPRLLIGFGNPLLNGDDGDDPVFAKRARERQVCEGIAPQQRVAALRTSVSGILPLKTTGGLADLAHIRMQPPLPETADELCAVAQSIRIDPSEIRLGARATEREVKALSETGQLAQYRIVHFATHGAMAGELDGASEPGLILTPPQEASAEDDGYLSSSEIAALKLDADWVILSACNTAAGDAANAEALSGLARAFIYAQARALLVSHWAVDSNATVKLITAALEEIGRDPALGRAEALRRAMLALIDKGEAFEAHPAYWAPFVVVGEGGH